MNIYKDWEDSLHGACTRVPLCNEAFHLGTFQQQLPLLISRRINCEVRASTPRNSQICDEFTEAQQMKFPLYHQQACLRSWHLLNFSFCSSINGSSFEKSVAKIFLLVLNIDAIKLFYFLNSIVRISFKNFILRRSMTFLNLYRTNEKVT